jgi:hypothetical protein
MASQHSILTQYDEYATIRAILNDQYRDSSPLTFYNMCPLLHHLLRHTGAIPQTHSKYRSEISRTPTNQYLEPLGYENIATELATSILSTLENWIHTLN